MRILSIDAWAGSCGECEACKSEDRADVYGCWEWNSWHEIGKFEGDLNSPLQWLIDEGYLGASADSLVTIEDDGLNLVITEKINGRPLYAIEYNV